MADKDLRLRVFAGPNGSGKSTVIEYVRNYKANNKVLDFGHYINADEIGKCFKENKTFSFDSYNLSVSPTQFTDIVLASGLISDSFSLDELKSCFIIENNSIVCKTEVSTQIERLAQMVADFLRKQLLETRQKFSFETVFSHSSKLDIMEEAKKLGYKVYLYFVSTESPEINKFRVLARKKKGGHDVPEDKIVSRYYRSLDLLYDAAQISYQAYFVDNSVDEALFKMFAHFKLSDGKKVWDDIKDEDVPDWFIKYYYNKSK